ncbi:MAG: glutaredoxin family protein [Candidatus Nomurabacteria bacterium]|nr:glutaredoxin family protein [Candidatus Nomurabacteria bacterium]
MSTKVNIYSTPTCHYCHMAKEFFTKNNIEYTDHNVAEDSEKRKEMMDMTGQMGVPVIAITKEGQSEPEIMVGFNEAKVQELLG